MNTKELYDHITKHMTPEQALMKLLEGTARTYDKLRFEQGEEVHPVILIAAAALESGWQIAIDDSNPDAELQGMVVGTSEYIDSVLGGGCSCGGDCDCNDNPPDLPEGEEN